MVTGRQLRDRGMEAAVEANDDEYNDRYRRAFEKLLASGREFTSDDVVDIVGPSPVVSASDAGRSQSRWVVEQRVGREWLACGHGPYATKEEAAVEAAVIGIGLTAGPFRVQEVLAPADAREAT